MFTAEKTHKLWKACASVLPILLAVFGMFTGFGCSSDETVSPSQSGPLSFAPGEVSFVRTTTSPEMGMDAGAGDWMQIGTLEAEDDKAARGTFSRYTLRVPAGAVDDDLDITVSERDGGVIDVQFGPHGTVFNVPVMLTIDYSGTNVDPDAAAYDESIPAFFYFNLDKDLWEEVPGYDNAEKKTYTVRLQHFSRYGLFGTTDWMRTAGTTDW